ncbi:MAG: sigma-70 family RNA polymerase sigma factor [Phycisphaeraceae bacterium]|nr:sigma-70 family RNA polymerase sigma factor [Phycisphaeraceae bacterium]
MSISHGQIVRVLMRERVRLLAFIQVLVFDSHTAEDVLQDISALAITKSHEINSEQHLLLWLRQSARYKAMNLRSKHQPHLFDSRVLDLIESDWSMHENAGSSEIMQALEKCLGGLSPYARSVIDSRYRDGQTGENLAQAVGRKIGSVYVQLSRIHRNLADCVRTRLAEDQADA